MYCSESGYSSHVACWKHHTWDELLEYPRTLTQRSKRTYNALSNCLQVWLNERQHDWQATSRNTSSTELFARWTNQNQKTSAYQIPSESDHDLKLDVVSNEHEGNSEQGVSQDGTLNITPSGQHPRRVLCLMSDTGGGHRASAQALKDCFELIHGNDFVVHIVDLWSSCSPWPFNKMPEGYFFLVKNPWLWRLNFRCSEPRFIHEVMFKGYSAIVANHFAREFDKIDPNLIVSVHPLMQHVPLTILRRMKNHSAVPTVPFATVVTDLTRCHATWFHKDVDKCFVATDLVAKQAFRLGLRLEQVVCHGLPIRPSFSAPSRSKRDVRAKLGLDVEAPTVMLVGGGEGMGKLKETAVALSQTLSSSHQVVVICGRNAKLNEFLREQSWPLKMVVKGFVNNMAEYMAACDCVISKAGPGTIAEALICGVPIVLNGCIPCQEEGNIPFVIDNQVGAYSEIPQTIAQTVAGWLAPENATQLSMMSSRARALGRPDATFDIVRDLVEMIETRKN